MQTITKIHVILMLSVLLFRVAAGQSLDEYLKKAADLNQAGDFKQAVQIMEDAVQKFPDNALAYSYLGLYQVMLAGQVGSFIEAGRLVSSASAVLDKAIALDGNNLQVRLNRGLMGVKVPPFLGKLDQGLADLEFIIKVYQSAPDKMPIELAVRAFDLLGEGYSKAKDSVKARSAWEKVIELAPDSPLAANARQNLTTVTGELKKAQAIEKKVVTTPEIEQLLASIHKNPDSPQAYFQLGQAYFDLKAHEEAVKALKKSIQLDSNNVSTYKLLIEAVGQIAAVGYDERIYDDTDFRTNLAFELVRLADEAVRHAPEDPELLLIRGRAGVMMPFFVDKLEQAIRDLEKTSKSQAPDEIKAEAIYWLGCAYQKKAMTNWINVIKNYSETEACKMAFGSMLPPIRHLNPDEHAKPFLAIDFVLGYRDELEPQTVVWIEDKNGNFVKTVYVSGFSAFAKEKQVNLPRWSKASQFKDVDGVSGASIDLGHHIYTWDLKDAAGKLVGSGGYVVKIEVSYWPSMQYQIVKAPITIGKKVSRVVVQEGNLIPYLEVQYFAK